MNGFKDGTSKWSNLLIETIEWEAEQREKRRRAQKNQTKEVVIGKLSKQVRQLANKVREQEEQIKAKPPVAKPVEASSSSTPINPSMILGPLPKFLPLPPKPSFKRSQITHPTVKSEYSSFTDITPQQHSAVNTSMSHESPRLHEFPSLSVFMYPSHQSFYQRPCTTISSVSYPMNLNTPPITPTQPTYELTQYATTSDLVVPRLDQDDFSFYPDSQRDHRNKFKPSLKPPTNEEWKSNPVKNLKERSDAYWDSLIRSINFQDKRRDKFLTRSLEDNLVYRLKIFREKSVKIYLNSQWEILVE